MATDVPDPPVPPFVSWRFGGQWGFLSSQRGCGLHPFLHAPLPHMVATIAQKRRKRKASTLFEHAALPAETSAPPAGSFPNGGIDGPAARWPVAVRGRAGLEGYGRARELAGTVRWVAGRAFGTCCGLGWVSSSYVYFAMVVGGVCHISETCHLVSLRFTATQASVTVALLKRFGGEL